MDLVVLLKFSAVGKRILLQQKLRAHFHQILTVSLIPRPQYFWAFSTAAWSDGLKLIIRQAQKSGHCTYDREVGGLDGHHIKW